MNIEYFNENIKPLLKGYCFRYSSFSNGDFGDLERIEIEGFNKVGGVEFWSMGWMGVDVYDCSLDDQVLNVLLSPEEKELAEGVFARLLEVLEVKST
jgi:hypothetical protein